jgi:hypothetical protein
MLVRSLAATVDVRALGRTERRPDAVLVTGRRGMAVVPGPMPVATWFGAEVPDDVPPSVVVVGHRPGAGGVTVPEQPVDVRRWPPLGPAVRRRWRRHLGLPDDWVVRAASIPAEDRPTALALCAAAIVYADLPLAFALGTPVVTGPEPAAAIGAGQEVVVPEGQEDPAALAAALAADDARAARLSRLARARAERDLDIGRPARELLARLGLAAAPSGPAERVSRRLDELGALPGDRIVQRARAAVAGLVA